MIIPEMLADLMVARKVRNVLLEKKISAYKVFEDNLSNLLHCLDEADERVMTLEGHIRDDTLAEYARTGNKIPCPGVQVKEMTRLSYEVSTALAWAKRTGVALTLNVKTFETLAKADPEEFPFVDFIKVPQAQIAQDLEKI